MTWIKKLNNIPNYDPRTKKISNTRGSIKTMFHEKRHEWQDKKGILMLEAAILFWFSLYGWLFVVTYLILFKLVFLMIAICMFAGACILPVYTELDAILYSEVEVWKIKRKIK